MKNLARSKAGIGVVLTLLLSSLLTACPATKSINPAPVAVDDSVTVIEGIAKIIDVLSNDTDADAATNLRATAIDTSQVKVSLQPSKGQTTVNTDGTITYTSNAGFTGADSFKYTAKDSEGTTSNEATVTLTVGVDNFVFATDAPSAYTRVDRAAMPAIATAVITSKNDYNAGNPSDDAALTFAGEIVTNVAGLHTALDDDLTDLGLTPCMVNTTDPFDPATSSCITQAAPLVVPDTLKLDTTKAPGFPNGRKLTDPVIDVTLAVILLDLSVEGQTPTSLVGVNPTANDKAFSTTAPYLAAPHTP